MPFVLLVRGEGISVTLLCDKVRGFKNLSVTVKMAVMKHMNIEERNMILLGFSHVYLNLIRCVHLTVASVPYSMQCIIINSS